MKHKAASGIDEEHYILLSNNKNTTFLSGRNGKTIYKNIFRRCSYMILIVLRKKVLIWLYQSWL